VLLTKPKNILYEIYVFKNYQRLIEAILKIKERKATLE
jgi:hypothetical protein